MTQPAYMQETWFAQLLAAAQATSRAEVARRLDLSGAAISQVLNASGLYGTGGASTTRIAEKVRHVLGNFVCPHLTEQHGEERVISGDQCRSFAHREPPTGSPKDLAHWQACRSCPHRALTAPPQPRTPVPRKKPAAGEQLSLEDL